MLRRRPTRRPPPEIALAPPSRAQLPYGMADFTGREAELDRLHRLHVGRRRAAADGRCVIAAIAGTAGVGKTALAVHWAHQIRDRFPDGQLYVNLRGFDPTGSAMEPAEAIRGFLDAFGGAAAAHPGQPRGAGRACTAACSPAAGCWSCWTTPATPTRSGRCCPARPAAWWW